MKRMFQEEDENEVSVMEPPCIPKQGKTVYLDDILGGVAGKGIRSVRSEIPDQVRDDGVEHTAILYRTDIPKSVKGEIYVNFIDQLKEDKRSCVYETADRINEMVIGALRDNRRITVSFKDFFDEDLFVIVGSTMDDIYDLYPEEQIDELLKIEGLPAERNDLLSDVIKFYRWRRDHAEEYAREEEIYYKIANGDY
jgi:hypothetical protein